MNDYQDNDRPDDSDAAELGLAESYADWLVDRAAQAEWKFWLDTLDTIRNERT